MKFCLSFARSNVKHFALCAVCIRNDFWKSPDLNLITLSQIMLFIQVLDPVWRYASLVNSHASRLSKLKFLYHASFFLCLPQGIGRFFSVQYFDIVSSTSKLRFSFCSL